ncbi:hypothetical protein [Mesorhizobium sp. WSM3626]|uniref:hypothetical protein n=1 Tax=Mesorhizobium sp. WSM3626 TaxID=1040987 RepID=UPI0012EB3942|nr:hypothetical protein [Mesorhizobium sp. WSM3626]
MSAFPSVDEGHREFPYLVSGFPSQADLIFYGGIYEGAPLLRAMGAAGDKRLLAIDDGCWDVANFPRPAGGAAEQGEGVLVLSGCPEKGHVAGAFARIMRNASDLQNYGANSYDATKTVLAAIHALAADGRLSRANVADAIRSQRRQGIAYPEPIEWDPRGGNLARRFMSSKERRFRQVAVMRKRLRCSSRRRAAPDRRAWPPWQRRKVTDTPLPACIDISAGPKRLPGSNDGRLPPPAWATAVATSPACTLLP